MRIEVAHFSPGEVECGCGCGGSIVRAELVHRLEALRMEIDEPMVVRSWYRCGSWNRRVGGVSRSRHLFGLAVDIAADRGGELHARLLWLAPRYGFRGIGDYPDFMHMDVRGGRAANWYVRESDEG